MKINREELGKVVVELDKHRITYNEPDWFEKENFLTSEGVVKLEEWKIDLIKKYGVDLDELQCKD